MSVDRSRRTAADDRSDGFSLIEMIVALVLIGLIGSLVAGLIGQFSTIRQTRADAEIEAELNAAMTYLHRAIGDAMALPLLVEEGPEEIFLRGTAGRIEFVSVQRRGTIRHALRETAFRLAADDGATLMQVSWPRRASAEIRAANATRIPVLSGISRLGFAYLGYGGRSSWDDQWTEERMLPSAVRITLESRRSGRTVAATSTVILRMAVAPVRSETDDP